MINSLLIIISSIFSESTSRSIFTEHFKPIVAIFQGGLTRIISAKFLNEEYD